MNRMFAYLLIFMLVTITGTQVFQTYFNDTITELSENCQDESCLAEPTASDFFPVSLSFSEHHYTMLQKAKYALYQHAVEGENHASVIDSPPESV